MKITYQNRSFRREALDMIAKANAIISEYQDQGFTLTLRQIFYQCVTRIFIANTEREYDRLGRTLSDARMAGLLDWDAIEDRTRNLQSRAAWTSPEAILEVAAKGYHENWWIEQAIHCEVWIEKDALLGVIEGVCREWDVPYFSCRGYCSQSEMHEAALRLIRRQEEGKRVVILHLGDFDPSGLDMTRDIADRLGLFCEHHGQEAPEVRRIALTWEQIGTNKPPPNPTKLTDSRASAYIEQYGNECWELDSLPPNVIRGLVEENIEGLVDVAAFEEAKDSEEANRGRLLAMAGVERGN